MQFEKYIIHERQNSVSVENSCTASFRRKDIKKTGVRVYTGERLGISGFLGDEDEENAKKKAVENLKRGVPYNFEPEKDTKRHEVDIKRELSGDELLDIAENTTRWIRDEFEDYRFSGRFLSSVEKIAIENTMGLSLSSEIGYFTMYYTFKEKASTSIFDGFVSYTSREFDERAFKGFARDILLAYNNNLQLPEKRMPVIFSEDVVIGKLLNELNPHLIHSGSSLFSDKMNKTIFSDKFSLISGRRTDVDLVPFFDAEGVIPKSGSVDIIKDGRILNPYTDKKIAKKYEFKMTANASAAYDSMPSPSPATLCMKTTGDEIDELIKGESCILVVMASGGDYTSAGDFGTPVQLSFLVEDGKIKGRLPELFLNSNLFDMYGKDFIGVSDDPFRKGNIERVFAAYMDAKTS